MKRVTSIRLPRSAATFDNSKPSATRSHSLPPPNNVVRTEAKLTIIFGSGVSVNILVTLHFASG